MPGFSWGRSKPLKGLGAWVAEEGLGLQGGTSWPFARLEANRRPALRGGLGEAGPVQTAIR